MNYSKWDKFCAEQSDSSDDESRTPAVHTVKDGQSVRIGPGGYEIAENQAAIAGAEVSSSSGGGVKRSALAAEIDNSAIQQLMKNGSRGENYFWQQDRMEVVVSIPVDGSTKGKDLKITYDIANKQLLVQNREMGTILCRELRHGILTETMTNDDSSNRNILTFDPADWEVKNLPFKLTIGSSTVETSRVIELVLHKASPLPGAVFWWSACFTGEPDIDVTKIAGRTIRGNASTSDGKSQEQRLHEDPFVQAQKMFAERMQNREKISVDLGHSETT